MEDLGYLEIVVGPERSCTELLKLTVQHTTAVLLEVNISTFDSDGDWPHIVCLLGCHKLENGIKTFFRSILRVGSIEEQLVRTSKVLPPVIDTRIQRN